MKDCPIQNDVERWFDAELKDDSTVEEHIQKCDACAQYLEELQATRSAVDASLTRIEITDGQFPAFMDGIREAVDKRSRRRPGIWTLASVASAALIVAVSVLSIMTTFSGGPVAVEAGTIIESCSTDIEGATTSSYVTDDGTATVWVNLPDGDMW